MFISNSYSSPVGRPTKTAPSSQISLIIPTDPLYQRWSKSFLIKITCAPFSIPRTFVLAMQNQENRLLLSLVCMQWSIQLIQMFLINVVHTISFCCKRNNEIGFCRSSSDTYRLFRIAKSSSVTLLTLIWSKIFKNTESVCL